MTLHVTKCDISQLPSPKTPSDTMIPLQPSIELCGLLRCTELSATAISSVPEKQIQVECLVIYAVQMLFRGFGFKDDQSSDWYLNVSF